MSRLREIVRYTDKSEPIDSKAGVGMALMSSSMRAATAAGAGTQGAEALPRVRYERRLGKS